MAIAASRGVNITLQDAATTGNGVALAIPPTINDHIFYIRGSGTINAGAITIETASDPTYTGTWSALPSHTDPTLNVNPITVVSAAELTYKYKGVLAAVRARISTTVEGEGGSVTVIYRGEDR